MEADRPLKKIAILTSGMSRGSNFIAICKWFRDRELPVGIAFVTVNKKEAPIIEKCEELGVQHVNISTRDMHVFEQELLRYLKELNIELIALAGFLKKLSADFIKEFGKPILNIHPALLPKHGGKGMYGMNVHRAVFDCRDRESGVTVHLVDENYDTGKIVFQRCVPVDDCHTPEEIAARVLQIEHEIYAPAIWQILQENLTVKR